jgi:GDP-L-fucose synthase
MLSRWKDDPVLVTGSTGVIGSALVNELRLAGFTSVTAVSSSSANLLIEGEALELLNSVRPKLVFHFAARVYGIMGNLKNKAAAYLDNIRINTNLIEAARHAGAQKIVAMGSTAIYSDIVPLPMSEKDIFLGRPHSSEAAYAHAKRSMLAQLEAYHDQFGLDYAFCVSTNLFGPSDKFDENFGHVIPSLISKFYQAKKQGSPIVVWGTGSPQRDFLYSKDAATALLHIADVHTGAINLASGAPVTIRDAVEALQEISGFEGNVVWDTSKPNGQQMREYDMQLLRSIGIKPRYQFKDALRETYTWYAANIDRARR